MIEGLEKRQLLTAAAVRTVGATGGVVAQAAIPQFIELHGTSHTGNADGADVDATVTSIDQDSALKVTIDTEGNGSIDATALNRAAVRLTDLTTGHVYTSNDPGSELQKLKTTGVGDALIIQTKERLPSGDTFQLEINGSFAGTNYVRTVNGRPFNDKIFQFTTNNHYAKPTPEMDSVSFTASTQATAGTNPYTSVAIGPDHRLYAGTSKGYLYSFAIGADGTLSDGHTITVIKDNNQTADNPNGYRLITGIAFDPNSTDKNLVIWVSHGAYQFGNDGQNGTGVQDYAQNFSGKISRINFNTKTSAWQYQDLVVNIPRSAKDHMNNQLVFSPDGRAAYFGIAAMNAMGGPGDSVWGNRVENIYSATIVQLRVGGDSGITSFIHKSGGPVNLLIDGTDTATATGLVPGSTHYNIFKGANPLRIYADGIRNDFDMVFASNGHLYAAINGSSAGGNTPGTPSDLADVPVANRPDKDAKDANGKYLYRNADGTYKAYTGPAVPALSNVQQVEEDALLDVKNGAYYGHPNPARGEYVLGAGNTGNASTDPFEFGGQTGYDPGIQPDRAYTRPVYDFGQDFSPDGILQYKSVNGVNANLNGYLLVARYSSGSDILALQPKADGSIGLTQQGISGLSGLGSPLDVTEDPQTGNLYVAVLTDEVSTGSLMLLKAAGSAVAGTPTLNKSKLSVYVTPGDRNGATATVTLTNTGTGNLTINRAATKIVGTYRKNFIVSNLPSADKTLAPGASFTFDVKGVLAKGQTATPHSSLAISVDGGYVSVNLRAFVATESVQSFAPQSRPEASLAGAIWHSQVVSQVDANQDDSLFDLV